MTTNQSLIPHSSLGRTTAQVSRVGLGTWQLGGADWGDIDEAEAIAMLHDAVRRGVNFIDTADVYGDGRSERVIGQFLRETSDKVFVATKLGRRGDATNGWPQNFTLDAVRRHTQASLERLGVERLFLTQWHCIPTDVMRDGEVFEHLRTIQREGLIENWGVSVESVEEGLLCMQHDDCASLQIIFNIFRQKVADELLPVAHKKGVGIIARVPLASGLLADKFKSGHHFDQHDHRHYNADGKAFNVGETFAGLPFERGVQVVDQVRTILNAPNTPPDTPPNVTADHTPMAQQAIRWILDHPAVSTVIPGATKRHQIESNCAAALLEPLSPQVHDKLRRLYKNDIAHAIRGTY